MEERILNAQEVACRIGVSVQTLGSWYKFKRENPLNEYSRKLPEFSRLGSRGTRYWREKDLVALREFHETLPQGRYGVLGSVTQRYVNKDNTPRIRKIKPAATRYIFQVEDLLLKSDVEPETVEQVVELLQSEYDWKQLLRRGA